MCSVCSNRQVRGENLKLIGRSQPYCAGCRINGVSAVGWGEATNPNT
jgi:hypothetical protein